MRLIVHAQPVDTMYQALLLIAEFFGLPFEAGALFAGVAQRHVFNGDLLLHTQQFAGAQILNDQGDADTDYRGDPPVHGVLGMGWLAGNERDTPDDAGRFAIREATH